MADLSTCYLGLELKSPLVLAASSLTSTPEGVRKAAAAGVGAVVLKSLFEEQLRAELASAEAGLESAHPEAAEYFRSAGMVEGSNEYLALIKAAKKEGVPVIASLNCAGAGRWAEFAGRIGEAGADALELNLGLMPVSLDESGAAVEKRLYAAVEEAVKATRLPVAVKLGPNWSSVANVAVELGKRGVKGLVLFNRFYRVDIDLATMALKPGPARSTGEEYHESLRWIAVLNDRVPCDLAASSGVHDAQAALRLVAAGARSVQLCSAVFKKGYGAITEINAGMGAWLDQNGVRKLGDLRGRLSQWKAKDPMAYLRLQYIQALTGIS